MKHALQTIFVISIVGMVFSGTLAYRELFEAGAQQCPSPGAPGTVWGYPACIYGFIMYFVLAVTASWGFYSEHRTRSKPSDAHPLRRNLTSDELL